MIGKLFNLIFLKGATARLNKLTSRHIKIPMENTELNISQRNW